jgi:hypothetical protein
MVPAGIKEVGHRKLLISSFKKFKMKGATSSKLFEPKWRLIRYTLTIQVSAHFSEPQSWVTEFWRGSHTGMSYSNVHVMSM